jgi:hypothetical protein
MKCSNKLKHFSHRENINTLALFYNYVWKKKMLKTSNFFFFFFFFFFFVWHSIHMLQQNMYNYWIGSFLSRGHRLWRIYKVCIVFYNILSSKPPHTCRGRTWKERDSASQTHFFLISRILLSIFFCLYLFNFFSFITLVSFIFFLIYTWELIPTLAAIVRTKNKHTHTHARKFRPN